MKILFFSFQQSLHVHSMPESAVAKSLIESGNEVVYLTCNGIYNQFCVNMAAFGLNSNSSSDQKINICHLCQSNRNKLTNILGVKNLFIEDFINNNLLCEHLNKLDSIKNEDLEHFTIDGHPLGKYAAYEFVITNKLNSLQNLNNDLYNQYRIQIKNCIITFISSKQIILELKPDKIIVYNNFYSLNRTFASVSDVLGVPHYSIHAGHSLNNRLNTLMLYKSYKPYVLLAHSKEWNERKNLQNSTKRIEKVALHFDELFSAKNVFVYSSPTKNISSNELKSKYAINSEQKVVLVLLTSGDERYAASLINIMPELKSNLLFSTQFELLSSLIEYFKKRNEIKVIIRPHPREYPNKRESVSSMQGEQLKKILTNLPYNFVVNWPTDNISLYDLIKIVDICLPTTSSSGAELSTLGMPVVTYSSDNIFAYPADDITFCAKSKEDYFDIIEKTLKTGWEINFSIIAFRWWAFKFNDFDIDLTDLFKFIESPSNNYFLRIIKRLKRFFKINDPNIYKLPLPKNHKQIVKVLEKNLDFHLNEYNGNVNGDIEEKEAVKIQLLKFHKTLGINKLKI